MRLAILFIFIALLTWSQDTLRLSQLKMNTSIMDQFELFESKVNIDFNSFFEKRGILSSRNPERSFENLDFTTSSYFVDFVLINDLTNDVSLILQTARPITNEVTLWKDSTKLYVSGDAIPYKKRDVDATVSALPIELKTDEVSRFILKVRSDGESLVMPMIFWDKAAFFAKQERTSLYSGMYYGIFIFVTIIYFFFFAQLRDKLFLFYTFYVLFSGVLQFGLDGYLYRFVFSDGGYLTHHSIILIAGIAVLFAIQFASRYLELTGRFLLISRILSVLIGLTMIASLIPGKVFELTYLLINVFSLLSVLYLLIVAIRVRRINPSISPLFMVGMLTLLGGAIVFIAGNSGLIDAPEVTQKGLKAGALVETLCLSILMAGKYRQLQEEKEEAQQQLLKELEEKNEFMAQTNIRLELEVEERTREIAKQQEELKVKNEDLLSSIKYAERIQSALLNNREKLKELFPESFLFLRPKDIVSGDFFWVDEVEPNQQWPNGLLVYATADCTGHGVPGAFVSIVCNNLLKLGKTDPDVQDPGAVLDFVNSEINNALNAHYDETIRDGMDVSLCAIDKGTGALYFAGARNGAIIIRGKELIELKADRRSVGNSGDDDVEHFNTQKIELQNGDMIYTFSDGFQDQFGGPNNKKFLIRRLKELLVDVADMEPSDQRASIENAFLEWMGEEEQVDDVILIGVRVNLD